MLVDDAPDERQDAFFPTRVYPDGDRGTVRHGRLDTYAVSDEKDPDEDSGPGDSDYQAEPSSKAE